MIALAYCWTIPSLAFLAGLCFRRQLLMPPSSKPLRSLSSDYVLTMASLVNVSVDAGAQGPLMPDMVVQDLAETDGSNSTTTDTLLNDSSCPSPRSRLRKIAPKPADNNTLALRVQAGVCKPAVRTKRTSFNTASIRAETSLTRTLNSCVRCRFVRNRVSDNI